MCASPENKKNLPVNYCCTHEKTRGCGEKQFVFSILRIDKIHLKKRKFSKNCSSFNFKDKMLIIIDKIKTLSIIDKGNTYRN